MSSPIADYADRAKAYQDSMDASIDGIQGDVVFLNEKIAALQASQGTLTPEDQALLDQIEARGLALADKVKAVDDMTPPAPPAPPA